MNKNPIIPDEFQKFFQNGRTLLIKGNAGTGKTTLSLEILRLFEPKECIYFSTKTPANVLLEYHPWLKDKVVMGPEEIRFLEARQESSEKLLNRLRDQLLKMEKPLLIVDTWDDISMELGPKEQLKVAKAIISTTYVTNGITVLVEETEEQNSLDFLVDGVVKLHYSEVYGEAEAGRVYEDRLERRFARELEIMKLRGVKISNKKYLFTLEDGRFRYFPPFSEELHIKPEKIDDLSNTHISSGIPEFDTIINGFKKGSFNLFEIEHGVDMRYLQIITQIAWNAVMNDKRIIIIPSIGERYPTELLNEAIIHRPKENDFKMEIKIMKEYTLNTTPSQNVVIFLGFDTFSSKFGPDRMLELIEKMINYSHESGAITIGIMKRGLEFLEYATHTAETHFVFKDINNALVLYGMRPKTELYAILLMEKVRLIPIV